MYQYNPYQKSQVMEAQPEDILVQLMEAAVIRLKQAREQWAEGNKERAREKRSQVFDIISYLDITLDMENGGKLAEELDALYAYMLNEITKCSLRDDFELLKDVQEIMSTLLKGWKDAAAEYKKEKLGMQPGNGYAGQDDAQRSYVGAVV